MPVPTTTFALEIVKTCIAGAAVVATVIAFISGLLQYVKAQRWKAAEFLAQQMKEFDASKRISAARHLLDISGYQLEVLRSNGKTELISISVQRLAWHLRFHGGSSAAHSVEALQWAGFRWRSLSDTDVAVRDCFDGLFESIERLVANVNAGLFQARDLEPYLGYVFDQMSKGVTGMIVTRYLEEYQYSGTLKFLRNREPKRHEISTPVLELEVEQLDAKAPQTRALELEQLQQFGRLCNVIVLPPAEA